MHTCSVIVRRPHVLLAALAVILAAVVAAGCGGSSVAIPELASFTAVAQKSSSADSARFTMDLGVTMPGTSKPLAFTVDGGFDTTAQRSQLSVDLSSFAELFQSLGAGLGASLGGTVSGNLGDLGSPSDWKLDAIQDGKVAYIHFPLLAKQLPPGKTWIKGDAKDLSSADAGQMSQFGSLAGTDPRDVFGMLKAVSGSIEAVGSETIRGVETSHYRATIDLAKLEQLVPAEQRQSLGGIGQSAQQAGLSEIPLDVWVDADQRVRKLSMDIDAKQPGTSQSVKASFVVELYDYGKALEIELPPAGEVVDASTLKQTS
jgi:hypothetical protein